MSGKYLVGSQIASSSVARDCREAILTALVMARDEGYELVQWDFLRQLSNASSLTFENAIDSLILAGVIVGYEIATRGADVRVRRAYCLWEGETISNGSELMESEVLA